MRFLLAVCGLALLCLWPVPTSTRATPLAIWAGASEGGFRLASLAPDSQEKLQRFEERLRNFYNELIGPGMPEPPVIAPQEVPIEAVCDALAAAARASNIPLPFFARLIWQESRFQQRAVSRAGAQGMAQFMPKVAAAMGLSDPFDPIAALPASAQLLQTLHRTFGNLGLAAAAYNAGPQRILDWLARKSKLPEETRNYVRSITGHHAEKWTSAQLIDLQVDLPARAPCDGVGGLSREVGVKTIAVNLEAPIAKIVADARTAADKAARKLRAARALKTAKVTNAANAAKMALAAKSGKARGKLIGKGKAGKGTVKTAAAAAPAR